MEVEILKDQVIVKGDVERLYLCFANPEGIDKKVLKENLATLLNQLLIRNPKIRYYQGLHDIAAGFLTVLDPLPALLAVETLCKHYI